MFQLVFSSWYSVRKFRKFLLLFDGWNKFQTSSYMHIIKWTSTEGTPSPVKKKSEKKKDEQWNSIFATKTSLPFEPTTHIFGAQNFQFFIVKTHSHPLTINPSPMQSPQKFTVPYHDFAGWRYNSPLWVVTQWYPSVLKVVECHQRHWWCCRRWCWSPVAKVVKTAGTQHGIFPPKQISAWK